MYCEHCGIIFEEQLRCPKCGGHYVRPLREDDPCFVCETSFLWGTVLEDLYRQNGVPFLTRHALGAALSTQVGAVLDRVRFYVRYPMLDKARTIADELFSEPEDDEGPDADAPEIDG